LIDILNHNLCWLLVSLLPLDRRRLNDFVDTLQGCGWPLSQERRLLLLRELVYRNAKLLLKELLGLGAKAVGYVLERVLIDLIYLVDSRVFLRYKSKSGAVGHLLPHNCRWELWLTLLEQRMGVVC